MFNFFAYLSRMKYIKRWGLMRNTLPENVQEHTMQVAVIAHALAVLRNTHYGGIANPERAATLALFHEAGEVMTGDLATPVKYFNPEMAKAFRELEALATRRALDMLPGELKPAYAPLLEGAHNDPEWPRVKAADRIAAYVKCLEELKSGNAEFAKARDAIHASIVGLHMPEVDYFMLNFIPGFSLTLDELNT